MPEMEPFSYLAGEKGRNRVRAFRDKSTRWKLFLEWREIIIDDEGKPTRVKRRAQIDSDDIEVAKVRADVAAAEFALLAPFESEDITITRLMRAYVRETAPSKGISKRQHDLAAERMFNTFFAMQRERDRKADRHPSSLDRIDWERFIDARREGRIPGFERRVKNRQIGYDLTFMISVLNWGTGAKPEDSSETYLKFSPWAGSIRQAQKWPRKPRELNPNRPSMTDAIRDVLIEHAPHEQFAVALVVERHTRRRNSAIRRLWWSDLNFERRSIRWRGELDKSGRANVTPMPDEVFELLRDMPERGIGDTPVFPSNLDPSAPTPRSTFQTWLRRAKKRAGVKVRGLGFHGEKRAGVRDPRFRKLPAKMQEELAGTSYLTLRNIYDEVTVDDMRDAMKEVGLSA